MSATPQDHSLTQQVLQAADIVDIVGRYVSLRRAGREFKALCPFHDDKHPSMSVSPEKQIFKCFACGAGGDAIKFIQLRENLGFIEARAQLAEQLGIRIETSGPARQQQSQRRDLSKINAWAGEFYRSVLLGPTGQAARQYVDKRGISAKSSETFQIGLAPDAWDSLLIAGRKAGIADEHLLAAGLIKKREKGVGFYDTFRNRLMFPIADLSGNTIGFGGRALDDNPAKYLNSPESALFNKGKTLFGLNLAREAAHTAKRVLVVEGYMDCLLCHQYGYTETAAVLGTALTDMHVQLLRRHVDSVILVFDGDEAGIRAADRALEIVLNGQLDVRLAVLPEGNDPADLLVAGQADRFEAALNDAVDALEFRWQRFLQTFDGAQESGPARKEATNVFLQFLAQMPTLHAADALQRGMWAVRVGGLLGLEPREIQQTLRRFSRPRVASSPDGRDDVSPEAPPARADAEQAALRQIIEVLLNEPAYYDVARDVLQAQPTRDPQLAEVARQLQALCESGMPWELTDLLARLPDAGFGRLVTDLQAAGERRGQFERTLDGAFACLQHAAFLRDTSRTVEQLKSVERSGQVQSGDEVDERLRRIAEHAGQYRHFAPPKWFKRQA